jgi:hypothetical protein
MSNNEFPSDDTEQTSPPGATVFDAEADIVRKATLVVVTSRTAIWAAT